MISMYYTQECAQCLVSKEEGVTNSVSECLGGFQEKGTLEPYFGKKKISRNRPDWKKKMHFKHFFNHFMTSRH